MTELRLPVTGVTLSARVHGPTDGVPLLALHGWLDNAASFDRLAPLLPEARFVALDLPGHGHSDWRGPEAAYHFIDWPPDVIDAADALGWQRFVLLGHSMGAGIATLVAGALPERVMGLVLVEGLGPMVSPPEEAPDRLADWIVHRGRLLARRPKPYRDRMEAAQHLLKVAAMEPSSAELLVARGIHDVEGGVAWRADPRLKGTSPLRFTEAHVQAFLRRIRCPALLVAAERGYPFDTEMVEARLAAVPSLKVARVPGGHHVHLDDPAAVAAVVAPFLRGVARQPGK